jgi:hypothetical protein
MGIMIEDGTGSGKTVKINSENRLLTYSIIESEPLYINEDKGRAFRALAFITPSLVNPSIETQTSFFYLKNESTEGLYIYKIKVWVENNEIIDIYANKSGTPVGGTEVVPVNANFGSGNSADGIFLKGNDITGLSGGTLVGRIRVPADHNTHEIDFESTLILLKNNNIVLSTPTGGNDIEIITVFYYHD